MAKILYVNPKKCIACRACEVACEREHDGKANRVVVLGNSGAAPVSCRHCEDSPCSRVCPTGALSMNGNGVMVLNRDQCTSCGLCVFACPVGAVYPRSGVMSKCDLCLHRLQEGSGPACAVTCPMGAIEYGEWMEIVNEARTRTFREMIGVMPCDF